MLDIGLGIVAAALVLVTLVPFVPLRYWWVRGFDFPRLQLASLALLAGLTQWLLGSAEWRWWSIAACVAVAAVQFMYILPWTPLAATPVKQAPDDHRGHRITLLIANVLTPNRNAEGLLRQIHAHQPDVILTLESDEWWGEQLNRSLEDKWRYCVRVPLDNLYGMHLFSTLPLEEVEVKWLIQHDVPSIHGWLRLPDNSRIRLHAMHPRPPAPGESEESLWRDAELLLVGQEIRDSHEPTLLAGDLNDVAWSRTTRLFCHVSGMLDPRRGRGMFSTFHAGYPIIRWPLDHIFISSHFTLNRIQRLEAFGSDHFPILASFTHSPAHAAENDEPQASADERREAEATVEEGRQRGDGEAHG
ncbi:endonuclease/exonuclease/phosphatase (EEP) superfamily protein YafD [Kushneria sinocarnis]|uniref:Endonuclease/exonuclease/phosphatase (EEP) superfamily protein YafD n=1 Tax=Kushneria sinocarnis TaxID=595502 RepID=A0A420WX16_9GAMM|nr:endonuclease/exonuclease/phosphatase family protein [Kushneria sinocarnis]RKR04291.1 endonuclease/exonuclease/phosphatase (EEP) superfamily protein YafD [Kushneria sinocarnis]